MRADDGRERFLVDLPDGGEREHGQGRSWSANPQADVVRLGGVDVSILEPELLSWVDTHRDRPPESVQPSGDRQAVSFE